MPLELDAHALRVLGALIEKDLTTPDYYPLTLSALVNACNQKTSREPVMNLTEPEVRAAIDTLTASGLVRERGGAGARVPRFGHRMGDSLGLRFGFERPELAVLAVLMLRGPQTPGEIKARTERMMGDDARREPEAVLADLAGHEHGPWVVGLPREPGRREARWAHLLGNDSAELAAAAPAAPPPLAGTTSARQPTAAADTGASDQALDRLRDRVAELERRLEQLERQAAGGQPPD